MRAWPPAATARRVISARPRVISAAMVLVPRPKAGADAGGDGDDVLERRADFDADGIGVGVEAEASGPAKAAWTVRASSASCGGDDDGGGLAAGDLLGEGRAAEDANAGRETGADDFRHDFGDAQSEPFSRPLVALTKSISGLRAGQQLGRRRGGRGGRA